MFRYIAFAWDDAVAERRAAALRLSHALQTHAAWQPVLLESGLHVFVAGARPGTNEPHPLAPFRGVVLGRLFRREEDGAQVDVRLNTADIARIVDTEGHALVTAFWGRYVAFLPLSSGTHVLRDPSGALPCFRLQHEGVGVAFSWLEGLLEALPDIAVPDVRWEAVGMQMAQGQLGGVATALADITQVPAGVLQPLDAGASTARQVWDAAGIARHPIDETPARAADRLRQSVRTCATAWANSYPAVLIRLSGGVDSSILLGCLTGNAVRARITCVNYHSPGSDSDERFYARAAAQRAGRALIERACDPGYRLEGVLDVALTPVPEAYVGRMSMAQMDAELAAADSAQALFTGGGGDQLFFEHRCTWPAADYLRVRGPDGGWMRAVEDAARLGQVSIWRAMRQAIRDVCLPATARAANWRPAFAPSAAIDGGCLDEFRHPCLAEAGDLPVGKFKQLQQLVSSFGYYDPHLRDAAPELVNPLLSQPVIELCLALPTYLLIHGGRGRALARRAFADDLPPQIASRRSKGGVEEHLTEVLRRNLPFVRELLLDGQLVAHGLIDRARLEETLSGRPSKLDAHIGEIHGLVAVEAWLQRRAALQAARMR